MSDTVDRLSPGNELYPDLPPMRAPHLEFVYRLKASMDPNGRYELGNLQGTGVSRSIAHIKQGTVRGPRINGEVIANSGADWAQRIHSKKIYYNLDARYAVRTDDGHEVFIQAQGIFRPGPGTDFEYGNGKTRYTQDEVEYFTTIKFEAAGDGPYNWMNGIVAIGALQSVEDSAIIDCWRLTNFPGKEVEDVYVGR